MKTFTLFHRLLIGGVIFTALLALAAFFLLSQSIAAPTTPTPPPSAEPQVFQEIEQAIQSAIETQAQTLPVFQLYENVVENIQLSADSNWATAWMTPVDPDTGEIVPTEPGLVIARRIDGQWRVYLPNDPEWVEAMRAAPEGLVPLETKLEWIQAADIRPQAVVATLTGYRLPYPGGDTRRLTQSVGHDRYTPSGNAHFSFDFATAYPSTLFQVAAAKAGTVWKVRWTQANGDASEPGNYIVLQDTSTIPTTYQLYLHLAQDSIPPELRVIGTPVRRGQYLGMADDTGVSSGHHLHFMVHTTATSYWGTSVDVVFEDVAINGGRPRIASDQSYCKSSDVCSQTQIDYLSQNFIVPDPVPPTGNILGPQTGAVVSSRNVLLQGFAEDNSSGLYSAQFIVNYDGTWKPVGDSFNINWFSYSWDMCAAGVPDGPVSVALQLRDKAFNQTPGLPGLTHFTKRAACPVTPACAPTANQVALFSQRDYQGQCVTLGLGSYTSAASLGALGDNNANSIQVGANVRATLFMDGGLQGRGETFIASDSNLNGNRIGRNTVSSVLVQSRTTTPTAPAPVWPTSGATFTADAPLTLSWNDPGGGSQFQARVMQGATQVQATGWQSEVFWPVSGLAPGSYTWQVKSRTGATESAWSAGRSLVIQTASPPPGGGVSAPVEDPMESAEGWTSSGGWAQTTAANHTPGGAKSWKYAPQAASTYDTGAANAGYLTSPPIALPAGSVQYLRFWYQAETESSDPLWDQRWVQISANGGPFVNVAQLYDDPANYWLRSPTLSLQAYAGQTIRVRFYFATLDPGLNAYKGWIIDDFSISATSPVACGDTNNTPANASDLPLNGAANAVICPGGDLDYFRFMGTAGNAIAAWTEAQSIGSPLDTFLALLDRDGRSLLVKNDDVVPNVRTDSALSYTLPADGAYFLKVLSWEHPSVGDVNLNYTIHVAADSTDPVASFANPDSSGRLVRGPVRLRVNASDAGSGVSRVRFLWHSADWQAGKWTVAGEDWDGTDGWSVDFDAGQAAGLYGGAVYALVFDRAGNWTSTAVWRLNLPGYYLPLIYK